MARFYIPRENVDTWREWIAILALTAVIPVGLWLVGIFVPGVGEHPELASLPPAVDLALGIYVVVAPCMVIAVRAIRLRGRRWGMRLASPIGCLLLAISVAYHINVLLVVPLVARHLQFGWLVLAVHIALIAVAEAFVILALLRE